MLSVYDKLKEMGITLPAPSPAVGVYSPSIAFGANLVYTSGCLPHINGEEKYKGKLGDLTIEEGQDAAKNCTLNALAILHRDLGDLNRIKRFVKVTCFVACHDNFYLQPKVANGASEFLYELFGKEKGLPSRSAVGVNALPANVPVEIEFLVEIEG
jgi:enamine deaminase RidA (YjgF/YER057c/UK114 family)